MWLTVSVAASVAVLSGLGVGSAGLFVIVLTVIDQIPQLEAQGINLVFFLFSSGAALTVHASKTKLPLGFIALLLLGGIPGSILGAVAAHVLPASLLRKLFGVMLILSGVLGLFRRKKS